MIEETLKTYLETVTSVKVFAFVKPLNETTPCITYQRISTETNNNLSGRGDLIKARFQINVIGNSYSEVKNLGELVISSMDCYTGTFESFLISELDTKDEDNVYIINLDFYIWYKQ